MANKDDKKSLEPLAGISASDIQKQLDDALKKAADWDFSSGKPLLRDKKRKQFQDILSAAPQGRASNKKTFQSDRRVTANDFQKRWGGSGKDDFTMIPNALLENKERLELTDGEMMVLLYLIKHWWYPPYDKNPFPRISQLAKLMWKKERQVQRILASLQEHETPVKNGWSDKPGYLYREPRKRDDGGQRSSEFDLSGLVNAVRALNAERQEAKEKQNTRVPGKPKK